jgi:hypothetical protein
MSHIAVPHPSGSYRFLPAISAYSAGVAPTTGYDIAAWRFLDSPSLAEGFERIDREIARRRLTPAALVGLELRSPAAFDFESFAKFNDEYRQLLTDRSLLIGEINPIARTNVIPLRDGPAEPAIMTAFIMQPSERAGGIDFIVAGAGEIEGDLEPENIVARGDLSPVGLAAKVDCVLSQMIARLVALGAGIDSPTTINVYTAHDVEHLSTVIASHLPATARNGFVRWMARPPVNEIEFEMDCRRFTTWRVI